MLRELEIEEDLENEEKLFTVASSGSGYRNELVLVSNLRGLVVKAFWAASEFLSSLYLISHC